MKWRTRSGITVAVCAVLALSASPAFAAPTPKPGPWQHLSGLWVLPVESTPAVPAGLSDALALAERISEEHPVDFGPAYVDRTSGNVVLGTVGTRGVATLAAFRRGTAGVTATGAGLSVGSEKALKPDPRTALMVSQQVRSVSVGHSRQELEAIKHSAIDLSDDPAFVADGVWQSEIDPASDRVVLTVEHLSDGLAARLVAQYGASVIAVRVDPNRPELSAQVGRTADNSPFYGGAAINTPVGGCTDAFSWVSGSTSMMLTAGHCVSSGGSVSTPTSSMGSVASGSRENWTNKVGTQYLSGQSTYRGDMALTTVTSGSSAGRIYRGGSTSTSSSPVSGMFSRRAQSGDQYCTGGSRSGEICGWTVDKVGVDVKYSDGATVRNAVTSKSKQGWCTRPGDSGGPVYIVSGSNIVAKGIHSGGGGGGSDYYGGLLDQCSQVFTDIYEPYYGFPGVIKTG